MLLGVPSFILVFLLIVFLVIRYKWRSYVSREEEITRLVTMASGEAHTAELEAVSYYSSVPVSKQYQCAVCYSPTTTRCSQCKSVRYCSGRCQIIHWRQGHKEECYPAITTMPVCEENDSGGKLALQNQPRITENVFHKDKKCNFVLECPPDMDIDHESRACADVRCPLATGFSSCDEIHESTIETSMNGSNSSDILAVASSDSTISGLNRRRTSANDTMLISPQKNMKPRNSDEMVDSRLKLLDTNEGIWKGSSLVSSGNKITADGATPSEVLMKNSFNVRISESTDSSRRWSVDNNWRKGLNLSTFKEERRMSFGDFGHHEVSHSGQHSVPPLRSANSGTAEALPSNIGNIPSSSKRVSKHLKTSMMKVLEQFRSSKPTKFNYMDMGREVPGKCIFKTVFPYKLFVQLYSYDIVELYPFGLVNCGNSCYANAVLQCLAFTRPLTSYLLQGFHSKACRKRGWCLICEFEFLIQRASEGESLLSPVGILSQIQKIGSHLAQGREEDAHEFLRYAVDTMQSICLKEAGLVGPSAEISTLVGLTFGGYLQSKIKCMKCLGKSEQCEQIMDLTVEIDGDIGTLEQALAQFTSSEILDGENKYMCSRCKSYVKAKKKLRLLHAPNILTIVLKRFQSGNFGKLNKSVQFPELLNLAPYMSGTSDKCPMYSLYAVIVHLDILNSAFSGHYISYVKNFQGNWFRIDDSAVIPVDLERVLVEGAYMLLYARHTPQIPFMMRNTNEPSDGKIKRQLEAIPSSEKKRNSKVRSKPPAPSTHSSILLETYGSYPYWTSPNVYAGNHNLAPDNWRPYTMHRNPKDSSSDRSSIFSASDNGSCSTDSTEDSAMCETFSGYNIFGLGSSWCRPYVLLSDSDACG